MTRFDELQQAHQGLLDRMDSATDKAAFAREEVQPYVARVCDEAVDVPNPRDRDQLRANLRFWASYLYDATGTYPATTMRPARPLHESQGQTIPAPVPSGRRILFVVAIVVLLLGGMILWRNANPQAGPLPGHGAEAVVVQPNAAVSGQPLTLSWSVVTAGPSPYNATIWVARIELSATGGNDEYIFWVNGQRLPEASNRQFTFESQGCQPVSQFIGVTSNSQSARQELVIYPPESNSCSK